MHNFTPGPWCIDGDIKTMTHGCTSRPIACDDHQVAYVFVDSGKFAGDVGDANALLIAAAPDLYEALKPVRSSGEFGDRAEDAPVTIRLSAEEFRAICRAMDRAAPCSDATDTPQERGQQNEGAES